MTKNILTFLRDLQRSKGAQESSLNKIGEFYLILDSACSSTLCGKKWLDEYLEHIGEEMAAEVKCSPGEKMFVFGGLCNLSFSYLNLERTLLLFIDKN